MCRCDPRAGFKCPEHRVRRPVVEGGATTLLGRQQFLPPGPGRLWLTTPQLLRIVILRGTSGLTDRDLDLWTREQEVWWDGGAHDQCLAKDEGLAARYVERGMTCGGA